MSSDIASAGFDLQRLRMRLLGPQVSPADPRFAGFTPAAVLVLRKHKADDKVLFIDASRDFEAGKNQNVLREADLQRILDTAVARQPVARYAYLATPAEIAENDFNLNIPRYVDTFEEEAEIDLMAVRREREQLKAELARLEAQMDAYLKELGYE